MHYSISIPMIAPLFSVFLYQFLVYFLSMQILFFCCHTTSDMPLLFIYLQHISHLFGKRRIDLLQSVCTVLMCGRYQIERYFRCGFVRTRLRLKWFHPIPSHPEAVNKYLHFHLYLLQSSESVF